MEIDFSKISNMQFDGIDTKDYPDFSDAYLVSADYEGEPMSEEMIDKINDNHFSFVYEKLLESI